MAYRGLQRLGRAVLVMCLGLLAVAVPAPVAASGFAAPAIDVPEGALSAARVVLTSTVSFHDVCHYSGPVDRLGPGCNWVVSMPGGDENFTGDFKGTIQASVSLRSSDDLATKVSGTGLATESGIRLHAAGTISGGSNVIDSCVYVSNHSTEDTAGPSDPGDFDVTGLRVIRNAADEVTDVDLGAGVSRLWEKVNIVDEFQPNDCFTGVYRAQFSEAFAADYSNRAGANPYRHWTLDPNGNWTPEIGGVLAEKRIISRGPLLGKYDKGTATVTTVIQLVTGCDAADVAAAQPVAAAAGSTARQPAAATSCPLTKANAGSYPPVTRGSTVTITGKASRAAKGHHITAYDWELKTTGACGGTVPTLSHTTYKGRKEAELGTFTLLCGISAKLTITVADNKNPTKVTTATDTTTIVVQARGKPFDTTPVDAEPDPFGKDTEGLEPGTGATDDTAPTGRDVSKCPGRKRATRDAILCPAPGATKPGFEISTVKDKSNGSPAGPFEGFGYVKSTTLKVALRGITNQVLGPDGKPPAGQTKAAESVFTHNTAPYDATHPGNSINYIRWLVAVGQHENEGDRQPHSGHTSAVREVLASTADADKEANIVKYIEDQIGPNPATLKSSVRDHVQNAEDALQNASKHPLAGLGHWTVYFWDPGKSLWRPQYCYVGGKVDETGCTDTVPQVNTPNPKVTPGQQIRLHGGPFGSAEPVQIQSHSQTLTIGSTTTDGRGNINVTITIPAQLTAGQHTITLTGQLSKLTATVHIQVSTVAPTTMTLTSSGTSTAASTLLSTRPDNAAHSTTNHPPAPTADELADTGPTIGPQLLLALGTLTAGLTLLLVGTPRTRRQQRRHQ